jgi:hypothetical protein
MAMFALVLASCGGDDEPKRASPAPPPPAAKTTTTEKAAPPAAAPRELLQVGVGDQRPAMFADQRWQDLDLHLARYVMPWNGLDTNSKSVTSWLAAAKAAGVRPLVAFNHSLGDQCPADPCQAPTPAQFEQAFRKFHARYPWVKDISPWNEANHQSQPTGRRPDLAAAYFDAVARVCPDCKIVAADVLTSSNLRRWLRAFKAAAKTSPRLYGLHNYPDTNHFRTSGTRAAMRLLDGEVWVTETGGIVEFTTTSGKAPFPADPERAARAVTKAFHLARHFPRTTRIYLYQWQKSNPQDRFDSGLVAPDGSERPALQVLRDQLRR